MANIIVSLDHTIDAYETVVFKAPCDCTEVTGLQLSYPVEGDTGITIATKTVTFKDAHGNTLTGLGNLFTQNALVKVLVDVDASAAYIQNADTNQYLENKFSNISIPLSSSVSSTSTTTAANSAAVKSAYDRANAAYTLANGKASMTTGTPSVSSYSTYNTPSLAGGKYCRVGDVVTVDIIVSANFGTSIKYMFTIGGIPSPLIASDLYFVCITDGGVCLNALFNPMNYTITLVPISDGNFNGSDICHINFSYIYG